MKKNVPLDLDRKMRSWDAYNKQLLRSMFTTDDLFDEYCNSGMSSLSTFPRDKTPVEFSLDHISDRVAVLESISERLDLIEVYIPPDAIRFTSEAPIVNIAQPQVLNMPALPEPPSLAADPTKVFVVHGRNEEVKAIVARFLERCGLHPIILHEQGDRGMTIIEKFEEHSDVTFAVVLLTPDDVGGLRPDAGQEPSLQGRARQNVVLELGYFVGKLGRRRVCAVMRGDVELPSDLSGIIYIDLDAAEGWKVRLAKELREAKIEVDFNKAFG